MSQNAGYDTLQAALAALEKEVQAWLIVMTREDSPESRAALKDLPAATEPQPDSLTELGKAVKLIRATATKIGLVFKPPVVGVAAAVKELESLRDKLFVLMVIHSRLTVAFVTASEVSGVSGECGALLLARIKYGIVALLSTVTAMLGAFRQIPAEQVVDGGRSTVGATGESDDEFLRLSSVGKLWQSCDELAGFLRAGEHGLGVSAIDTCAGQVKDSVADLEEWLEDPIMESDEDPFGIGSDSGEESEEEARTEVPAEMVEKGKAARDAARLVALLLAYSGKKTVAQLPVAVVAEVVGLADKIVADSDEVAVAIMTNTAMETVAECEKSLDNHVAQYVGVVAQHCNETAASWYSKWHAKFAEDRQK